MEWEQITIIDWIKDLVKKSSRLATDTPGRYNSLKHDNNNNYDKDTSPNISMYNNNSSCWNSDIFLISAILKKQFIFFNNFQHKKDF